LRFGVQGSGLIVKGFMVHGSWFRV
jgi:hypothetical protein